MWNRTFAGLIGGLLVSVSWVVSFNLLVMAFTDWSAQSRLLTGLLVSFVVWAGVMTWCYAAQSKGAWLRWLYLLLPSVVLNIALKLT